jgi:hypothetical protein
MDLRRWNPSAAATGDPRFKALVYRRFKVLKQPDNIGNNLFRFRLLGHDAKVEFRFPRQQLQPKVYKSCTEENSVGRGNECQWEAQYDFQRVLRGESVDLLIENLTSGHILQHNETSTVVPFSVGTEIAEMTVWVLLPEGKAYRSFRIIRKGQEKVEEVKVASEYLAEDFTILAFRLLSLKANYNYELQWDYR